MKVILEFNLPDEQEEYDLAINGHKFAICLEEINSNIRQWSKYENRTSVTIEELRSMINDVTRDHLDWRS